MSAGCVEGPGVPGWGRTLPDGAACLGALGLGALKTLSWLLELVAGVPEGQLCYVAGQPLAPTAPCTPAARGQETRAWFTTRFRMQPR